MNHWSPNTPAQIAAYWQRWLDFEAATHCRPMAAEQRAMWEAKTAEQLDKDAAGAWTANDGEIYALARFYRAQIDATPEPANATEILTAEA